MLKEALDQITKDPELVNYAKQSIMSTLDVEFFRQNQPAALKDIFSSIEMIDGKKKCFSMELYDNEIVKTDEPVFYWMPYKNTYFIDNPFIVGDPVFIKRLTQYTTKKILLSMKIIL